MQRTVMFWRSNKYILITLAGSGLVFICFYFFFLNVFAGKIEDNMKTVRKLNYDLSTYYGGGTIVSPLIPMDAYFRKIRKLKESKKNNVERLKETLTIHPGSEYIINKGEYPGSYFKKILDQKRRILLQESSKRNIDIPETLGFGEALPPDNEASDLLKFLFVKEQLIRLAVNSGVEAVHAVNHFSVVKTGSEKTNRFINEYPVKITIRATVGNTLRMLYKMRSGQHFLILRNLEIHSPNKAPDSRNEVLGVTISVAGMTFEDIKEPDMPFQKEKPDHTKHSEHISPIGI